MKINSRLFSPCQVRWILVTTLGLTASPLGFTTTAWGQTADGPTLPEPVTQTELSPANIPRTELTVPQGNGEIIADIQIRLVNAEEDTEGSPDVAGMIKQFQLQPGDSYDPELAHGDLSRIAGMAERVTLTLEPATEPDQIVMVVTAEKPNSFFYDFGSLPRTTALAGPLRPVTVNPSSNSARGFSIKVHGGIDNIGDNNQRLTVGLLGGENTLGAEVDFRQFFQDGSGYGLNFENRRGIEPEFEGGDNEVDLANGDDPWVHRLGGGVEYFRPLAPDLEAALGVSYQRISIRDDAFTNDVFDDDELGNSLTVSDSGQDDLLTINLVGKLDRRNDADNPTQGYRFLFGTDQSIPIGDADILFNRLSANYTQFLPLNLFGFTAGPRTLVLNVQGGTIIGDTPPYEAFSLGGSSSVRGYSSGELGTGESFVQATAEYRFPMFSFNALDDDIDVGGTLFFDYASDLGTGDDVIGEPAEARDKPGDGFGYGLGVRALTSVGAVRLEFGLNDEGDSQVIFKIGDRF
ncbi:BamA/TamA family outer membrane protein [Leptothoe spongobia]|uniref:BamA/TamA family outer membrane protein n=1 Tax=Leptothoe spongobia TAU-MAC 1115 TaxID=1967444 RepID=A0A947GHL7_9CYAN|nr:BamA/TamA family outer membrane protein [Leptothoe spongobia]MBT9314803.1 BamA/TamA family outer membrane protein [Leptothoe spongobia TAU-MAC 1115]